SPRWSSGPGCGSRTAGAASTGLLSGRATGRFSWPVRAEPARRYDGVMAVTASEAKPLDAHALRADFPIFEQRFHGKSLAFLDTAASSQKPRQMLDAMRDFYETS